ncbi:hypothetical protein V6U90_30585 [Micromonospora sp. CPCC 206060]|uniref:hypothetical protein n=1 Tax=Micromonospora sp. CPCC 206060 TaxID=3122406 RepID=UPI002FF3AF3F
MTPQGIEGFIEGTPDFSGRLRAERAGNGGDRVYRLTYAGHDEIGRPLGCTVTVTVPHDQGLLTPPTTPGRHLDRCRSVGAERCGG